MSMDAGGQTTAGLTIPTLLESATTMTSLALRLMARKTAASSDWMRVAPYRASMPQRSPSSRARLAAVLYLIGAVTFQFAQGFCTGQAGCPRGCRGHGAQHPRTPDLIAAGFRSRNDRARDRYHRSDALL